ncbi:MULTISPECIES: ABC transporter substrate-binding protein [Halomonadaceae]|uniref:ABC transporter substrate-binding protein n=1 Tax=Halomonadaceae TaxID=28256 RepID=UPI00158390DC|nr:MULTISPECIES: ABC transporter substrate-binding protein [Halomonas]MDI4636224.1 ABC transporter substrate-binding protein [Halomonas sp. BMC7]NUJ60588.1 ABC transporter substrate-binding protein [Halomonas taeanensis]
MNLSGPSPRAAARRLVLTLLKPGLLKPGVLKSDLLKPGLLTLWLLTFGLLLAATPSWAEETLRFPGTASATQPLEQLTVHGALDIPQVRPLLEDFHRRFPFISLTYRNLTTLELNHRFLAAQTPSADVLISSAMPWQYRLANDGHAQPLTGARADAWPNWARWRHELFAVTFEPIVMVYRRELAERFGAPQSHAELLDLLEQHGEALRGRVVTYDPEKSGAGYSYAVEEARLSPRYWELVAALGATEAVLEETTGAMLQGLKEGKYWLGYNLLGSYAQNVVADDPALEMVIPKDYALVTQRLALIPKRARHPVTAQRFLDYLISEHGQRVIAERTALGAVHPSLKGPGTANALKARLGDALRPIRLSPALLATLDDLKRRALLARWQREFRRWQSAPEGAANKAAESGAPSYQSATAHEIHNDGTNAARSGAP